MEPTWTIRQGDEEYAIVVYQDGAPHIVRQSGQATLDGFSDALVGRELDVYHPLNGRITLQCRGNLLDVHIWLDQYVQDSHDKSMDLEAVDVDLSEFLPPLPKGTVA